MGRQILLLFSRFLLHYGYRQALLLANNRHQILYKNLLLEI